MRTRADKALTELRRERYERFLRGASNPKPVAQRIADSRAKRDAAQHLSTNKDK